MITISDLEKYDPSGMYKIYDRWPDMAREAYESDYDSMAFDGIDHIVFVGMGGSGAIGDIFASLLYKKNIHVSLVKGYLLPSTVDSKTLVVITSISGNTVETNTVLKTAKSLNCKLICFTSGGAMKNYCVLNKIEYHIFPKYHSPRASFITYVYGILKILKSIIPISESDVQESLTIIDKLSHNISSCNLTVTNMSLNLADWLSGIPLIYYPMGFQSTAVRFKSSIQENAKNHAIIEDIIEACHNNIVAWETKSNVNPILIRGPDDYVKTQEHWEIIKKFLHNKQIDFYEINSCRGGILSKLVYLIYLLDYSSIYFAIKRKTDPSPVLPIEFVKKQLSL